MVRIYISDPEIVLAPDTFNWQLSSGTLQQQAMGRFVQIHYYMCGKKEKSQLFQPTLILYKHFGLKCMNIFDHLNTSIKTCYCYLVRASLSWAPTPCTVPSTYRRNQTLIMCKFKTPQVTLKTNRFYPKLKCGGDFLPCLSLTPSSGTQLGSSGRRGGEYLPLNAFKVISGCLPAPRAPCPAPCPRH